MADTTISSSIYQGEGKWFRFTLTQNNLPMELAESIEYTFAVKTNIDDAAAIFESTTFDISERLIGIIRVNLPASTTSVMPSGLYYGQLKITFVPGTDVAKSQFVKFMIKKPVIM